MAAGGRVEAGGRLVEEDQLGVAGDAEREVEPAALAAGQRRGAVARAVRQADQLEHLVARAAGSGRRRSRARPPRAR